ncbi:MAG: PfkB family carbohydrate kinase [Candidatus Bathyarchaeota archaeon]|nr:PfkB family carbohydrate kinase [Candidatus Bathyarchaeota archaeon]
MVYDLVAIGNPVYDVIFTPYIQTDGRVLSGCSTNACLAAAKLGMKNVALIGSIGKDYYSRFLNDLDKYGIKSPKIKISQETGGFKLVYPTVGDRTLEVLGVAGKITAEDVPEECLDARYILIGPILQEVDLHLVRFLKENTKAKIFLDPQGLVRKIGFQNRVLYDSRKETMKEIVSLVDFVKPNEHEAVVITETDDPAASVKILSEWGAPVAIVTLAERGSIVLSEGEIAKIPPYETIAPDPTGAGDVYAGSFIYEHSRTGEVLASCLFASAGASIMVEHTGPDFPMTDQKVRRRLAVIKQ